MELTVHVGRAPGSDIKDFMVPSGTPVSEVLDMADIEPDDNEQVLLNGQVVADPDDSEITSDNSSVLVTREIKGNQGITVTVACSPGPVLTIGLDGGYTVADAIREYHEASGADLPPEAERKVLVNGVESTGSGQTLSNNDRVVITREIKGN